MDRYVRITPPGSHPKAKCRRYTLGGRLFEAGNWYSLSARVADTLREIEQYPGVKVFQIYDEDGFNQIAQHELVLAARAAGFEGLAQFPAQAAPNVRKPKEGPVESRFSGLDKASTEVDMRRVGAPTAPPTPPQAPPVAPLSAPPLGPDAGQAAFDPEGDPQGAQEPSEGAEAMPELNLEGMTHKQLDEFAATQSPPIELPPKLNLEGKVTAIENALADRASAE